jgi:transposase
MNSSDSTPTPAPSSPNSAPDPPAAEAAAPAPKCWSDYTHFAGFDWAKDHHNVIIVDRAGQIVADFEFAHSGPGWQQWRTQIAPFAETLAVTVETSQGVVIECLLAAGATVFPIAPLSAKAYRQRKKPSGTKTDRDDAWSMADALRLDGHGWRALAAEDPHLAELRLLCRDEQALIEERTALINQLQAALHEYYPCAEEAFDDWTSPHAWAFISTFPTPQALAKAGRRKWEKFLHSRKLSRPETYARRMAIFERALEFVASDATTRAKSLLALARVRVLVTLEQQLTSYRAQIERLFAEHPDHHLFGSLPGAGPKLGPRLLAEIGSDRARFPQPQSLQTYAGTAPVSYQSGQINKVLLRRQCNRGLRHTVHLFANLSRAGCAWAETYYRAKRAQGKSHAQALRCLGQRWLKIIWKMLQTSKPYDAELHAKNQILHGSWVLKLNAA